MVEGTLRTITTQVTSNVLHTKSLSMSELLYKPDIAKNGKMAHSLTKLIQGKGCMPRAISSLVLVAMTFGKTRLLTEPKREHRSPVSLHARSLEMPNSRIGYIY